MKSEMKKLRLDKNPLITNQFRRSLHFLVLHLSTLVIFAFFSGIKLSAQELSVKAQLDTSIMLIGDQQRFSLIAEQDRNWQVEFPQLSDTLLKKIEILEQSIDTTHLDSRMIRVTYEYLITSFDSGFYVIPQQKFKIRLNEFSDSILTDELFLIVNTFQIDSIQGIVDIKPPKEAPLTFREALPWIGLAVGILAILVLLIWWYKKYRNRIKPVLPAYERKIPAHTLALDSLEDLKKKKLWQQGKVKEYHSELTDILRRYLEQRFRVQALEQTSEEILAAFQAVHHLNYQQQEHLKEVLILADLVKFAKLEPQADQNEKSFSLVWDLVLQTKISVQIADDQKDELKKGEEGSK